MKEDPCTLQATAFQGDKQIGPETKKKEEGRLSRLFKTSSGVAHGTI